MEASQAKSISKFLSLVLRHRPETIGIQLDEAGWADVNELLAAMKQNGRELSPSMLKTLVSQNDKQRFDFDESGARIRASQGHSVPIELGYAATTPPDVLLHGTPETSINMILREGLRKMGRHHVHLHVDPSLATKVASRRGRPALLVIDAQQMHENGFEFFVSKNGVWLTEYVPPQYLAVLATDNT